MKNNILTFINKLEGFKTAIKNLHWSSNSLPQHQLCDDIAKDLSDFQDTVSEIEQGIHGNIKLNQIKGVPYTIKSLKPFVTDVIKASTVFYKQLKGDEYIGMRSEAEAFLGKMQKNLYLVNFTLKEDKKRREAVINEMRENTIVIERHDGNRIAMTKTEFGHMIEESVKKALGGF